MTCILISFTEDYYKSLKFSFMISIDKIVIQSKESQSGRVLISSSKSKSGAGLINL